MSVPGIVSRRPCELSTGLQQLAATFLIGETCSSFSAAILKGVGGPESSIPVTSPAGDVWNLSPAIRSPMLNEAPLFGRVCGFPVEPKELQVECDKFGVAGAAVSLLWVTSVCIAFFPLEGPVRSADVGIDAPCAEELLGATPAVLLRFDDPGVVAF
jgi:hypothetical protein